MTKGLYILSFLSLVAAGLLFALCGMQWAHNVPAAGKEPEVSLLERFQARESSMTGGRANAEPPLIEQARIFARYLNPPKPPPPKETPRPKVQAPPVRTPPRATPKFRLLSISYYRPEPERSVALVSEPGKGGYWIKKGERLGHLVIERVEEGALVYRDGDQIHEMMIAVQRTIPIARQKSGKSETAQSIRPSLRLLNGSQ